MIWVSQGLLVGVLLTAACCDLRRGKIYNWLTYPAIIVGLVLGAVAGWEEFLNNARGLAAGFGVLFIGFLLRGIGGGDVKLMGAIGALGGYSLKGEPFILYALFCSFAVAVVIGILKVVWKGAVLETLKRLWIGVRLLFMPGVRLDEAVPRRSGTMVPFGLGVCIGTVWCLLEMQLGGSLWGLIAGSG
ncbi:MAG: A24 family peptidase [Planctomycetia bacterium]|nr:A24 family peptidase [Planctomycetia bacterium]